MAFKAGDRVRMKHSCSGANKGCIYPLRLSGGELYTTDESGEDLCGCERNWELVSNDETNMSDKYYRVKKDTAGLEAGAILKFEGNGYKPISDIWNTDAVENGHTVYLVGYGVEHAPDWYERVYPINLLSKVVYKLKAEAKELMNKEHTA